MVHKQYNYDYIGIIRVSLWENNQQLVLKLQTVFYAEDIQRYKCQYIHELHSTADPTHVTT